MLPSARVVMTLSLIVLGLTPSDSSGASKPIQEVAHQTATAPDPNGQEHSSPNPDATGIYHVGDGVSAPILIYSVDPEFTDKARRKKLSGTCIVSMVVDRAGRPQDVRMSKSIASDVAPKLRSAAAGLDEKAIEAAKQYRFKPATYRGKPVPVEIKVEVAYRIY